MNRTLLLTGASRGIGHATVKVFQAAGWRVLTVSRSAFDTRCPWHAGAEDHIQGDLADPLTRDEMIAQIRDRLGGEGLHAIVNNAGISPKGTGGERMGVANSDEQLWQQVMAVNLIGPAALMRDLLPELERGQGTIVNVGSIAGSRVHPFAGVAYACSKAALAALTREAATELGPRVTCPPRLSHS
nr:SDR family NAD(P)-dependent oxidoreductase [Litoreibacter arenae]